MKQSLRLSPYLLLFFMLVFNSRFLFSQNSAFVSQNHIKRGFRTFNMNRFSAHAVMYIAKTDAGDSLCAIITDSIRYTSDTVLARTCGLKEKGCSDTLIPPGERFTLLNNSYWQKIPVNRLKKIKSKRQPIARITAVLVGVTWLSFVTGAIVASTSKHEDVRQVAGNIALIGDLSCAGTWAANLWLAKKRFNFNKFKTRNSFMILF